MARKYHMHEIGIGKVYYHLIRINHRSLSARLNHDAEIKEYKEVSSIWIKAYRKVKEFGGWMRRYKKRITISSTGGLALLTILALLPGELTHTGNIMCAEECVSYVNYTPRYFDIYIPDGLDVGFVPNIERYKLYIYEDDWIEVKPGKFTFKRGQLHQFKIIGYKNAFDTVKWNLRASDTYLDPVWNGIGEYKKIKIAGREYTPICYAGQCHLPVNLTFYKNINLQKSDFGKVIKNKLGNFNIIKWHFDYLTNKSYTENYDNCTSDCQPAFTPNMTPTVNCTKTCYPYQENKWKYVWKPIPNNINIKAYKPYIINIWVEKELKKFQQGGAINIVPKIKNYELPGLSWWNETTYDYAYQIIENSTDHDIISINDSHGVNGTIIWAYTWNDSYLLSSEPNIGGNVAVGNTTTQKLWEDESTGTGYEVTTLWHTYDAFHVWHLHDNVTDAASGWSMGGDGVMPGTGMFGTAGDFEYDESDYLTATNRLIDNNTGSIEVWFKMESVGDGEPTILEYYEGDNDRLRLYVSDNDNIRVYSYPSACLIQKDNVIYTGIWYHVVAISDGSDITIYLNGTQAATGSCSDWYGDYGSANSDFWIGAAGYQGGPANTFDGIIDEVRIYDRILTPTEILEHWWDTIDNNTRLGDEETVSTSSCQNLSSDYTLVSDVSSAGTCFNITADNIVLDCANYQINYSTTEVGYAINNTDGYDNVTIKNCDIIQGNSSNSNSYGIYASGMYNSTIKNNDIETSGSSCYAIYLSSGFNNTLEDNILNTTGSSGRGIYFNGVINSTIENNTITTYGSSGYGLDVESSYYNEWSDNIMNTYGSSGHPITTSSAGPNSTFTDNTFNAFGSSAYGFADVSSNNLNIREGYIFSNQSYDYYLHNIQSNNYTNTNFTTTRQIRFNTADSWFNYNNNTTTGIWLMSSPSVVSTITRELINWNNTLVKWNDTNTSGTDVTMRYNISGLLASTSYNIYNNSVLVDTSTTNSNGILPSFTIYLSSEHEIYISKAGNFDFNVTLPSGTDTWRLNVSSCTGAGCYQTGTYQPTNQSPSTAFFIIGNNGTTTGSVKVCLNTTPDACMFWYLSTNNTLETGSDFNITADVCTVSNETVVTSLAIDAVEELWSFLVFSSCTPGTQFNAGFLFSEV